MTCSNDTNGDGDCHICARDPSAHKNPVWETMTQWTARNGYRVRVWREEPHPKFGPDPDVMDMIEIQMNSRVIPIPRLIELIAELPRISAIEVVDPKGNGTIFYPDWK